MYIPIYIWLPLRYWCRNEAFCVSPLQKYFSINTPVAVNVLPVDIIYISSGSYIGNVIVSSVQNPLWYGLRVFFLILLQLITCGNKTCSLSIFGTGSSIRLWVQVLAGPRTKWSSQQLLSSVPPHLSFEMEIFSLWTKLERFTYVVLILSRAAIPGVPVSIFRPSESHWVGGTHVRVVLSHSCPSLFLSLALSLSLDCVYERARSLSLSYIPSRLPLEFASFVYLPRVERFFAAAVSGSALFAFNDNGGSASGFLPVSVPTIAK